MDPVPPTLPGIAAGSQGVSQESWNQLTSYVQQLGEQAKLYKEELEATKKLLAQAQAFTGGSTQAKPSKPAPFSGKLGAIEAWCHQMDSYLAGTDEAEACRIASTYLEGEAFAWWYAHRQAKTVESWTDLREALIKRFNPLNKVQAARNKLHSWRQIKDVGTFNKTFLSIVMDIPGITVAEQIDRYTHGLKREIWEALCTRTYDDLEVLMTDVLRIEAAKAGAHRGGATYSGASADRSSASGVAPMDLSSIKIEKLTPEERQRCMREGLCLRCREKGHLARDCPKGQRN